MRIMLKEMAPMNQKTKDMFEDEAPVCQRPTSDQVMALRLVLELFGRIVQLIRSKGGRRVISLERQTRTDDNSKMYNAIM